MSISDIMVRCFIYIDILLIVGHMVHITVYKTAYKKGFYDGYRFGKVDGKVESEDKE